MRRFTLTIRGLMIATLAVVVVLGGGLVGIGGAAAAQDEPQTSALLIEKRTCPSAEAARGTGSACEPGEAGIRFEVMTTDGAVVGDCVTEVMTVQASERAACWVENVPLGTVVVTEDVSTLPPGIAPLTESQTVTVRDPSTQGPDYINVAVFYNIPVVGEEPPAEDGGTDGDGDNDGDPGDGVAQLPETGTGPAASMGGSTTVALLGVLSLVAAAGAGALRRRLM